MIKLVFILISLLWSIDGSTQNIPPKRLLYCSFKEWISTYKRTNDTFYIIPYPPQYLFSKHFYMDGKWVYIEKQMPAKYSDLPSFEQRARSLALNEAFLVIYAYRKEGERYWISYWHPFTGGTNQYVFEKKHHHFRLVSQEEGAF